MNDLRCRAESNSQKQRYVRLNARTGVREVDVPRLFQRTNDTVTALDGFFASRASLPHSTLYFVSSIENETRLTCMASDDEGQSWYLYAQSEQTFVRQKWHGTYSIGGTPELTAAGRIVGTFTHPHTNADSFYEPDSGSVYFLRIQAGRSQATVANVAPSGVRSKSASQRSAGSPQQCAFAPRQGNGARSCPMAARWTHPCPGSRFSINCAAGCESSRLPWIWRLCSNEWGRSAQLSSFTCCAHRCLVR